MVLAVLDSWYSKTGERRRQEAKNKSGHVVWVRVCEGYQWSARNRLEPFLKWCPVVHSVALVSG